MDLRPRKVIYLLTTLGFGGTERNAAMFCERINRDRFIPEVWYLHDFQPSLRQRIEDSGIVTRCLNAPRRKSPVFAFKVARQIAKADCDLFHVFLPSIAYYFVLAKLVFRCQTPAVMSVGGVHTELPFEQLLNRHGISRLCYPILCNSKSVQDYLVSSGIPGKSIRVLPNGHDTSRFQITGDRKAILKEFSLASDVPTVISVGRFVDSKRHRDLLQALRMLRERGLAVQALLVGQGPLQEGLESLVRELGIQNTVHFAGNRNDIPQLLAAVDCFAFPSENEGLPNAVIEAALARVPIAACRAPGVVDVVTHEKTGLLSLPRDPEGLANSIARLLGDQPFAKRLTDAALADARERFDISRIMPQLHQAYEDALSWKAN